MTNNQNSLDVFKKDKHVLKFMRKYRYQYYVTMLPDLAELVHNAYLEGYNNGLGQHPLDPPTNTIDNSLDKLREELAAIEHDRWSDWQLWCHEVIRSNVGKIDELEEVLARWDKQAITPYEKLSDKEKASDMEQVDRYWHLIEEYISAAINKTIMEAQLDIVDRISKELEPEQSPHVNKDDTLTYYYTIKSVEWAIERIRNQITKKYGRADNE